MNILIIKLGATGDVVRTTPLLHRLAGDITWITAAKNTPLLEGLRPNLRCLSWQQRDLASHLQFDLAINLEDTPDVASFLRSVKCNEIFGAYINRRNKLCYTENSAAWFDLSLISTYGKESADKLKLQNRRTYQDMIFEGLGFRFAGEEYVLPKVMESPLSGDIALAVDSGPVWPMKRWAYYEDLRKELVRRGFCVNILPKRNSLLEHLSDVCSHSCLVGGDSLPMHFALGTKTRCVSLFTCTSPWEIYDYGVQKKIVSPLLAEFFYHRGEDRRAATSISLRDVEDAVITQIKATPGQENQIRASSCVPLV